MNGGAHTREGEAHDSQEGAIPEADNRVGLDGVEKSPGLVRFKHGSLAAFHDVLGSPDENTTGSLSRLSNGLYHSAALRPQPKTSTQKLMLISVAVIANLSETSSPGAPLVSVVMN